MEEQHVRKSDHISEDEEIKDLLKDRYFHNVDCVSRNEEETVFECSSLQDAKV